MDYTPSFVDGIGSMCVIPAMWPRARRCLAGAFSVSPFDIANAVRLLATRNCLVAEVGCPSIRLYATPNHDDASLLQQ